MRSRVITAPAMIVAYNIESGKLGALKDICGRENMKLREVSREEANCQIGFLCGFKGFQPPAEKCDVSPEEECLVFSGIDRRRLQQLLELLKSSEVYVPLKAVCTPSNQSWTFSELITELLKEHKALNGGGGR